MESSATPLYKLIHSIEKPSPVESFLLPAIEVYLHTENDVRVLQINGLAQFHTIEDLHRTIWLQSGKQSLFYPTYSFLGIQEEDGTFTSALGTFYDENRIKIVLPDPMKTIQTRTIQSKFVKGDDLENISVAFLPRSRTTLEDAFIRSTGSIPSFHIFSLSILLKNYTGPKPISQRDWSGLFYPYFPSLRSNISVESFDYSQSDSNQLYIKMKLEQVKKLEKILKESVAELSELHTKDVKYLSFQWTEKSDGFQGVDTLFYGAPVTSLRPYMRLITPNNVPLTKLYKPEHVSMPQVSDPVLLRGWVSEPLPLLNESFLISKILIRKQESGILPLYATLRLMDDATADFVIQPPKDVRDLNFQRDLFRLSSILQDVTYDMPFNVQNIKIGRANINVVLDIEAISSKNIQKRLESRVSVLSTIFQKIIHPKEVQKPLLSLRYKAISNFFGFGEENKDKINSYLTYSISRRGIQQDTLVKELSSEFQISEDQAISFITQYFQKVDEHTIVDSDGKEFLTLNNPGIDIGIYSEDIKTISIQFYNLRAIHIEDFVRVCTILNILCHVSDDLWETYMESISDPKFVPAFEKVENIVQANTRKEEAASSHIPQGTLVNAFAFEEDDENTEVEPFIEAPKKIEVMKKPDPKEANTESQRIVAYKWFITQLQKMDPILFDYKPEKNKGERHYTSKCAANWDRQPAILTQEQYLTMRKLYAKDEAENRVGFIVYGVPNTEDTLKEAKGKREQITVLRYGSNVSNLHYFLCSPYFCLRDKLPILLEDWLSDQDKQNNRKPRKSCAFCHGTEIVNRDAPGKGETVIVRKDKPGYKIKHQYVGFQSGHPSGVYGLPCCFTGQEDILWSDDRFKSMRDAPRMTATEVAIENKNQEDTDRKMELQESYYSRTQQIVSYDVLRYRIGKDYVLGQEKYPLDPGKIGMPSVALDEYFGQDSSKFVSRTAIKQEFKPNVNGFFRLGVLNKGTFINQSLFAALAPLLGKSTIQEVQRHFSTLITPRVFVNLNFGNLLLEFFDPSDPAPSSDVLNSWTLKHLQIDKRGDNDYELSRFFRSYHRFIRYINDSSQKKELRHFVHALAEPDLLAPEGLTIITLEYKGDPRNLSTDIDVRCPILGFDITRYSRNMIGFLTVNSSGIWEPMVYISKINRTGIVPREQEGYYALSYADIVQPTFPQIVLKRVNEFMTTCRSSYRGAFTIQRGVDTRTLIPVTRALEILQPLVPTGLVRDSYNHLVAMTVKGTSNRGYDILVPIVDDGNSFHLNTDLKIHLGFQTVYFAPANDVLKTYKEYIEPRLKSISPLYILDSFIRTNKIIGFMLKGDESQAKILLPCGDARETLNYEIQTIEPNKQFKFEYELNREIMIDTGRDETYNESAYLLQKKQADDIYQHLRVSFSNWIATKEQGYSMRNNVDKLLERNDLPSWEKLRRLQIEFGSLIAKWFSPDPNPFTVDSVLIRNDCISIENEESCTNMCKFDNGSCKIHTPEKIQINTNGEPIDAVQYFTTRLFDELLRIPVKRQELFENSVRRIQVPTTNIHIGDQWILPENVPAWYDLLRESLKGKEVPQYYEEFSRNSDDSDEMEEYESETYIHPLPESIKNILPESSRDLLGIRVVGSPSESKTVALARYLGMDSTKYVSTEKFESKELSEISNKYNKRPVIQILMKEPMSIIGRKFSILENKSGVLVLIPDYVDGPAVLILKKEASDIISEDLVKGKILESIEIGKRTLKTQQKTAVKKPVVIPIETNSSTKSTV
jgi:hypothetical protein